MAEQLGEAVLILRTDDSGLDRGIGGAETKARTLGGTFDRTSASTRKMSVELTEAGRTAVASGAQFQRAGQQVAAATGGQRQGLQQLSFQIGDVAQQFALGVKPQIIFAQQAGQVIQAIQLMGGGTSKLAAFLGGPWGIALSAAAIVLTPLIGKLFETEDAMKKVEFASSAMADAQGILGNVIDLTTGKINTQSAALIALARAQLAAGKYKAIRDQADARSEMVGIRKGSVQLTAGMMGGLRMTRTGDASADIVSAFQSGDLSITEAERGLRSLADSGLITAESYDKAAAAVTKFGVAAANIEVYDQAGRALDGDAGALEQFLNRPNPKKPPRPKKPPKDRSAEIAERQADQIDRLEQEELNARLDLTTDVNDRAAIQGDLLNLERNSRIRQIKADKDLSDAQKAGQLAYIDRLYGKETTSPDGTITVEGGGSLLGQKLARDVRAQELQLANDALARQADALSAQADIATNLDKRDELESRALEIHQQIERNLLDQDIANGRIADADQARALLAEKQAAERARQLLAQRTPMQVYRDQMRATAENMDREIETIEVRALDNLNDGLVDAIMGAKSLGEVFHDVANQIISDLLRIAIQQMLIRPLAELLFGGGGGGGGLLGSILGGIMGSAGGGGGGDGGYGTTIFGGPLGSDMSFPGLFGGGRALGGPIAAGTAYLVGESGPELIVPPWDAHVVPNRMLQGGGNQTVRVLLEDTTGLFKTRVEQISAPVARESTRQGIASYDQIVGNRVKEHLARRSS